jgi:hypothetical protein
MTAIRSKIKEGKGQLLGPELSACGPFKIWGAPLGTFDFYHHLRFTSCPAATHDYSNMRSLIRLVTSAASINLLIFHRLFDDYVGCMSVGDKQSGSVSKSSGVTLLYSAQHKAERQRSVHQRPPIIHLPIYHLRISGLYHTGEELPAVGEAT